MTRYIRKNEGLPTHKTKKTLWSANWPRKRLCYLNLKLLNETDGTVVVFVILLGFFPDGLFVLME